MLVDKFYFPGQLLQRQFSRLDRKHTHYRSMTSVLLVQIISVVVIFADCAGSLEHANSGGCTAPVLLPDKPFLVVWNHPTGGCAARGIDLHFEKWGIVDNSKDRFIGEQIALFYNLGQFPRYSANTAINGGIPQLGNLTYHLQKVESDIKAAINPQSFSGLGVIDFESWRPIFWLNYDSLKIYETKSLELAKERFPSYNSSQLLEEATKEFNAAARSFMVATLKNASLVGPGGRWGYYGYPRCWDPNCNTTTILINDMLSWIYNSSTGLYPSIYFDHHLPVDATARAVKRIIHETLRVRASWSRQDSAILPYSLVQQSAYDFFTLPDLANSIREPADMGSSGVVLWGSSSYMQAKNECLALQDYINKTLGPFSLQVTNFFANCTQQLCQGHGRCVRKDYERYYQHYLQKSGRNECYIPASTLASKNNLAQMSPHQSMIRKTRFYQDYIFRFTADKSTLDWNSKLVNLPAGSDEKLFYDFDDYVCRCFAGWSGAHCDHTIVE